MSNAEYAALPVKHTSATARSASVIVGLKPGHGAPRAISALTLFDDENVVSSFSETVTNRLRIRAELRHGEYPAPGERPVAARRTSEHPARRRRLGFGPVWTRAWMEMDMARKYAVTFLAMCGAFVANVAYAQIATALEQAELAGLTAEKRDGFRSAPSN